MIKVQEIKFGKCPYGDQKDQLWEKLRGRNIKIPARLVSVEIRLSTQLTLQDIRDATFSTWSREDWEAYCKEKYGVVEVAGLWLVFTQIIEKDGSFHTESFKTFRSYNVKKHRAYLDSVGHEFKIRLVD